MAEFCRLLLCIESIREGFLQIKSTLHCSVGPEALISNNPKVKPGTPKTLEELIEMFHSTKWDLGADYFIVD